MIESLNAWTIDSQDAPPAPPPAAPATPTTGAPPPAPTPGQPSPFVSMVPFIIIFVLFYLLLIRPQRRQQKEREKMILALKPNDHVITTGGLCGIVVRIKDNDVYLRIDEKSDVKVRVLRSAIAVVEKVSGSEEGAEKK